MPKLPSNARTLADGCGFMEPWRREAIITHLEKMPAKIQSDAIEKILQGAGDEARFLLQVLGKDEPGSRDAQLNKKISPPETA